MPLPATAYCQNLAQALATTEVTDRAGVRLSLDAGADRAMQMILATRVGGHKVMVIGNGGSAAIASHVQNDLGKAVGLRAMVFTETPILTAFANDLGYEVAYQKQIDHWADPGDLLLAISSSGASKNILNAVAAAEKAGCRVLSLSGFAPDNPLRQRGDLSFYVPARSYGAVELAHAVLTHLFTDAAAEAVAHMQGGNHELAIRSPGLGARRSGLRRGRVSA